MTFYGKITSLADCCISLSSLIFHPCSGFPLAFKLLEVNRQKSVCVVMLLNSVKLHDVSDDTSNTYQSLNKTLVSLLYIISVLRR